MKPTERERLHRREAKAARRRKRIETGRRPRRVNMAAKVDQGGSIGWPVRNRLLSKLLGSGFGA